MYTFYNCHSDALFIFKIESSISTFCKQIALQWFLYDRTFPIFYRQTLVAHFEFYRDNFLVPGYGFAPGQDPQAGLRD